MSHPWMERAACLKVNPEWFFTEDTDLEIQAIAVCRSCPVRYECLEYAKTSNRGRNEQHGIWGGRQHERMLRRWTTPNEIAS